MMYKSPITLKMEEIAREQMKKIDGWVMENIKQKLNLEIDPDELMKALEYDRAQYIKGYNDAIREMKVPAFCPYCGHELNKY